MICVGLLIMFCNTAAAEPVDSFCQVYQPVIQQKGDGDIKATPGVKRRTLANETTYRKLCPARPK